MSRRDEHWDEIWDQRQNRWVKRPFPAYETFDGYKTTLLREERGRVQVKDLRDMLRAAGATGLSKLHKDDLLAMAGEWCPEAFDALVEERVIRWRWMVAKGLDMPYEVLAELEGRIGVEPDMTEGKRGAYRTWDDVCRVYEHADEVTDRTPWCQVRLVGTDEQVLAILGLLRAGCDLTEPQGYERREDEGMSWYLRARPRT